MSARDDRDENERPLPSNHPTMNPSAFTVDRRELPRGEPLSEPNRTRLTDPVRDELGAFDDEPARVIR